MTGLLKTSNIFDMPTAPAAPEPADVRGFGDIDKTRSWIYDKSMDAVSGLEPVANKTHTLALTDVSWADPGVHSKADRKKAVLTGGTLGRRIKGTWVLRDAATGDELDRKTGVVAAIPHLTEGGTFVKKGTEYGLKNQQRLRAGIYTRVKDNGELESHVNVLDGGPTHRYSIDPSRGVFYLHAGQARIPLLPLLQEIDPKRAQELGREWGPEILAANQEKSDASAVTKLQERFDKKGIGLKAAFEKMTLDPEVTRRTLGHPHANLNYDAVLAATKKLLAVSRGEAKPDDRDDLTYQTFMGPEDLIAERLKKDRAGVRRQLLYKATRKGHLQWMPSGALQGQVDSAIGESGLGEALQEINSMEILDKLTAVSRMGEGGIPSTTSIPDSARSVHPSQANFIDPIRTSESFKAGVDLFMSGSSRKTKDGRLYAAFHDPRTGSEVLKSPQDVADSVVAFPSAMQLPGKRIPAMKNGRLTYVRKEDVDLIMPHFEHAFSAIGNMVPLKSMVKPQRAAMGSRMLGQALPLVNGEAPLVQSAVPGTNGTESFEERYSSHAGAVRAAKPGTVISAGADGIKIRHDDGTVQDLELHQSLPYNRKSFMHQQPLVTPGQRVGAGTVIAGSNFTDKNGAVALGQNTRVAYLPWGGQNFEDAIVISESMAKRMSSVHAYQHQLEVNDKTRTGLKSYVALFPGKYDRKTLEQFDTDGRIKPGTTVNFGDPLLLAAEEKTGAANKIHRKGEAGFNDASITWNHHDPGVVTDVVDGRGGPVVVVKSVHPMQVADKASGVYGDKGVVAAIIPDHQMPQDSRGRPFEALLNPLGVISRGNPAQWVAAKLGAIAEKTGKPFKVEDFDPNVPDRIKWVQDLMRQHGVADTEDIYDPNTDSKIPGVYTGNRFLMKLHHTSESKSGGRSGGSYSADETPAKGGEQGCFVPKQKILTHLGPMQIAKICENRLGVQVRTFDEVAAEWVYRPVTDWFTYKADISEIVSVHTVGGCCDDAGKTDNEREKFGAKSRSVFAATKNHVVICFGGNRKTVGELTTEDLLTTWGVLPTKDQWHFLYGTMLGDGYANADLTECGFEHSVKQKSYIRWKKSIVSGLVPKQIDTAHYHKKGTLIAKHRDITIHGRRVFLINDFVVSTLRKNCYGADGSKIIRRCWLDQLSDLSVAVWILDDGSITNRAKKKGHVNTSGNIAIMGLSVSDRQTLCDWFNARYATDCIVNIVGAISLTADACRKMINVIADNVPASAIPKSKRFLRRTVAKIQQIKPPIRHGTVSVLGRSPLRIKKIEPYQHDKPGIANISVYDFTVKETHTYIAGHALVANSKRVSLLDLNALLSHGATEVIRDAKTVRGQKNDDYWLQFMQGHTPRQPRVPLVYQKFLDELKASGINVKREGSQLHLMAMTDKDVDALAGDRDLQHGHTVNFGDDLKPVAGGLFDPKLAGGHNSARWSAIKLSEPFPNPVFEEPIRRLLGLTGKKYEDVIAGREQLDHGTGPGAIKSALDKLDVDRELAMARAKMTHGSGSQRDEAVRKLGYLKTAKRLGIHPRDWMLNRVPVLPPQFRPISVLGSSGVPLVSDPNFLYRELMEADSNLKNIKEAAGEGSVGEERLAVYNAFKAVTGLGDPITQQSRDKNVRGILQGVFGSSPKFSCYDDQTEILTKTGWVYFPELIAGVEVATLNPETGAFEWQLPDEVQNYRYIGEMVKIEHGHGLNLLLTPSHRNWVRVRRGATDSADNIETGWHFEPAWRTVTNNRRAWFRTAASSWQGRRLRPRFLSPSCTLEDFAAFVGWWTAEGWLSDRKLDRVQLSQACKKETYCREIDCLVRSLGCRYSVGRYRAKPNSKCSKGCWFWQWSIHSAELAAWLTVNVRRGAANKKLSRMILDWDSACLTAFYQGYMHGDGSRRKDPRVNSGGVTHRNAATLNYDHVGFSTVSSALADDMVEIGCKLGVTVKHKWNPARAENELPFYSGGVDSSRFVVVEGTKGKSFEPYDGYVYCCSVPNGIVYVRRGGKPVFSGNSLQRKLLSTTVDNVGRAVISPNPDFDMDTVGIPEDRAFDVYQRFIVRRLKRSGMPLTAALQQSRDKTPLARAAMLEEMEQRPVIVNRAPVLHRYGILALRPQLVKGSAVQMPPLVVKGMGADFDGDCKSLTTNDLWCIDGVMHYGKLQYLVKLLDTQWPPTKSYIAEIAAGRLTVPSFNDDKVCMLPVSHVHFHTQHDAMFCVSLRNGFSLTTTSDHGMMTFAADMTLKRVRPVDLRKAGSIVPVATVLKLPVTVKKVAIGDRVFGCNYALGYLVGHYLGDGGAYDSVGHVRFTSNDAEHLKQLYKLIGDVGMKACEITAKGKHKGYRVYGVKLFDWFRANFGTGSFVKNLPAWCLTAPKKFRLGIVDGLISTNGWITKSAGRKRDKGCVGFSVKNEGLTDSFAVLLRTLGVCCSKFRTANSCVGITVAADDFPLAVLTHPKRSRDLQHIRGYVSATRGYLKVVPWNREICAAVKQEEGLKREDFSSLSSGYVDKGYMSLAVAKKLAASLHGTKHKLINQWLKWVNSSDIVWVVVEKVRKVKFEPVTFDVTVPGPHLTVCPDSGIVAHQTVQFHVPVDEEARKEALDRMLPSRQLLSAADFKSPVHVPTMEYVGGLWNMTAPEQASKRPVRYFRSVKDVKAAWKAGEIGTNDRVVVMDK